MIDELAALHPNARVDKKAAMNALRADIEARRRPAKRQPTEGAVIEGQVESLPPPRGAECEVIRAAVSEEFRSLVWDRLSEDDLIVSEGGRALADAILLIHGAEGMTLAKIASALDGPYRMALFDLEASSDPHFKGPPPLSNESVEEAIGRLEGEKRRRERHEKFRSAPSIETAAELYPSSN